MTGSMIVRVAPPHSYDGYAQWSRGGMILHAPRRRCRSRALVASARPRPCGRVILCSAARVVSSPPPPLQPIYG
jgi:hypothetical protein